MSSMWGETVRLSIFGGSHTKAIGVTLDGLPAGEKIDWDKVLLQMSRRAPGQDKTATRRVETDEPKILCGMLDNVLTGAPLTAVFENSDNRSKDYENLRYNPRPGHSDYTAYVKYGGNNDIRGGGHFSGRLTAPIVFAGAVCRQILEKRGILIGAHAAAVGGVKDTPFDMVLCENELLTRLSEEYFPVISQEVKEKMRDKIEERRLACDSAGGLVECKITGVPAGLGEPMFGGVENVLSSIIYGIPAVKGVEFGAGFKVSEMAGSENNDGFYYEGSTVRTYTNNCGGILGGITNGMPIIFRAAIKPTPSIALEQNTVDLKNKTDSKLIVKGRHDPCVVPRAVPVVESAAAIGITELLTKSGMIRGW